MTLLGALKSRFVAEQQPTSGGAVDSTLKKLEELYALSIGGIGVRLQNYPLIYRCTNILAEAAANVMSDNVVVTDFDGEIINNADSRSVLRLLNNSPDGKNPAYTWFVDLSLIHI